ncbi:CinA family protein [Halanaeroarchaeum sulfurireducens]|uniref:CinA C-terminal domain-containing protein n=1 Tax=Halanaeroarchaeum sulfurireducens TaxID=1604004 RepID=A0A0F7PCX9_9EURY|nr:CinA family protein [Halanaeroarchaeum sulfurireducens]AKH97163.1 CinA C-terminal domain-containing protein [Halanaeroarchaeum sulfurireducens]ALG81564.1 CinA C-terminal domain-containing protein [Halanaeroarchaeum sulfurireducens]
MSDETPVEERIGTALSATDQTLATAESCTGGLIGSLLTDVPGSSDYFDRAYVTYSYDAKLDLGVARETLDEYGAVSEPVAAAMARGSRDRAGTTWGVATTGVAGPTGGTDEKPVGTVYVGIAYAGPWGTGNSYTTVERREFAGTRTEIKTKIARWALELLEREIDPSSVSTR